MNVAAALAALSLAAAPHPGDGRIALAGLRFDSRDVAYKSPVGAVPAGTAVRIRFRTTANDVSSVRMRVYDLDARQDRLVALKRVQKRVACGKSHCDLWQATLATSKPATLWYRFLVRDGKRTVYYEDDSPALDGGLGAPSPASQDLSWALTVYDPSFTVPAWTKDAVVYQIFPDRFRNGDPSNDPKTGDPRYDDPVLKLPWSSLPEGYCRSYTSTTCGQSPRGRDYMGGDLKGVTDELDYLKALGVTAIYLNPIFWARSNHRYDTADYRQIDPYLGTEADFENLVAQARARGIRLILDGVFNHMSSDSPFFDRYSRYPQTGACESTSSSWRGWFVFTGGSGPCAGGSYAGWANFDSLPVLNKGNAGVRDYFLTGADPIAKLWLERGASGWRLDVFGDSSFPASWWPTFRTIVKQTDPQAVIEAELWPKDSTLLRALRGDEADGVMNYRLRDAVLDFLAPGDFDAKGFPDSGHIITPSTFASRVASIYEDYPQPAWPALLNLIDSHDTERALWTLTPGDANRAGKEQNAANVAAGKARLRLAALIQFTVPGMPTVYYGDEVGVTGADDPDDRRTYPWPDTGGSPDTALLAWYQTLGRLRHSVAELADGPLRFLLTDNRAGTVAYGRQSQAGTAIVVVNRSGAAKTFAVPVGGYLADGTALALLAGGSGDVTVAGGRLQVSVPGLSGVVLATK